MRLQVLKTQAPFNNMELTSESICLKLLPRSSFNHSARLLNSEWVRVVVSEPSLWYLIGHCGNWTLN